VINEEASVQAIKNGEFDAVIVAAGATPVIPEDVHGINSAKVTSAFQVLHGKAKLGQKIAVIGGGIVGTEVGLFLAEKGKEVVFVEMLDTFMNNITFDEKLVYEERFKNLKVSVHTGKRLERVEDKGITVIDRYGIRTAITAETVVLAAGFRSNRDLIESLRNESGLQVFEVGDCVRPRKIFDAIHDGHLAAKLLS
jgi:2-enoate reductase